MESESFVWAFNNIQLFEQPRNLIRPPYLHYWGLDSGQWKLYKLENKKSFFCCIGFSQSTSNSSTHSSSEYSSPPENSMNNDLSDCINYDGIVEHIILDGDSIESIIENYQCSIHLLVQCNDPSILTTLPKYLRIPVKKGFPISKIQTNQKNVLLQRLLNETDLTQREAEEFLISYENNYVKIMNEWDQTHTWEQKYLSSLKQSAPLYTTSYSRLHREDIAEQSVTSALPPPPIGSEWKLLSNGQWELQPISSTSPFETVNADNSDNNNDNNDEKEQLEIKGSYFVHQIRPSDTLEGICLKYHKTQREVMKLNHLSSKKIQFLTELRIPLNANEKPVLQNDEENTEETVSQIDLCQRFAQETNLSVKEARYYLQLYSYNYEDAFNEWKAEEEWSQANATLAKNTTPLEIST